MGTTLAPVAHDSLFSRMLCTETGGVHLGKATLVALTALAEITLITVAIALPVCNVVVVTSTAGMLLTYGAPALGLILLFLTMTLLLLFARKATFPPEEGTSQRSKRYTLEPLTPFCTLESEEAGLSIETEQPLPLLPPRETSCSIKVEEPPPPSAESVAEDLIQLALNQQVVEAKKRILSLKKAHRQEVKTYITTYCAQSHGYHKAEDFPKVDGKTHPLLQLIRMLAG